MKFLEPVYQYSMIAPLSQAMKFAREGPGGESKTPIYISVFYRKILGIKESLPVHAQTRRKRGAGVFWAEGQCCAGLQMGNQ
jgi:hypothetical protein